MNLRIRPFSPRWLLTGFALCLCGLQPQEARAWSTDLLATPPELTVAVAPNLVLTFDDSSKSHFTVARPLLKKYKFGATFFVTEGFDMTTNKRDYMTWDAIARLHKDGFEIGNHTRDHMGVTDKTVEDLAAQIRHDGGLDQHGSQIADR